MKTHYIPQYNEHEFNTIAKHADDYYANQRRKRMSIEERFKMAKRIANLRSLPRRNIEEEKELNELVEKYDNDMRQIGIKEK